MNSDKIQVPIWMHDADDPIAEQIVAAIEIADEALQGDVENLDEARQAMIKALTVNVQEG